VTARTSRGLLGRLLPVVGLFFAAPLVLEYLSGDVSATSPLPLLGFGMLNGCAAIAIREAVARRGGGWWRTALLGVVVGLVEEGLLDQSLFNPAAFGIAGWLGYGYVPVLGTSTVTTLFVLGVDAVCGVLVPITLVELLVPHARSRRWLGRPGLAVVVVLLALGATSTRSITHTLDHFTAAPAQLLTVSVAALALAALALLPAPRATPTPPEVAGRAAPRPRLVAIASLAATSLFLTAVLFGAQLHLPVWAATGLLLATAALSVSAVLRWSRHGWNRAHRLAATSGTLITWSWFGLLRKSADTPLHFGAQIVLVVLTLSLLAHLARPGTTATPDAANPRSNA